VRHRLAYTPLVGLALLALFAISGCGGGSGSGNGVASKSPDAILAATSTAAHSAGSVHVSGSLVSGGSPITLDLDLAAGRGGRGQLSESGLSFELIVIGDTVYIKGSDSFYRHFGGSATAQLFHGKWLRSSATSGELASLASLTNLGKLLDQTLTSHATLVKGATSTVAGQQAIELRDTANSGSLYIATTGPPYPIEIVKHGAESGSVTFTHWNEHVPLSAPANAIDLSQIERSGGH
jgi:hypothetical protein